MESSFTQRYRTSWWGKICTGFICSALVYYHPKFVTTMAVISGPSMLPTLEHGDIVLSEPWSVHVSMLNRGDLVSARIYRDNGLPITIVKRLIAVPGDMLGPFQILAPGFYWIQGDNPDQSIDSRWFGPIPSRWVQSRVFLRIWPPQKIGFVRRQWPPPSSRHKWESISASAERAQLNVLEESSPDADVELAAVDENQTT